MNRICNTCNINIVLKDRSVCKSCYDKNRRKNTIIKNEIDITPQQPKIENVNNKDNNTVVSTLENYAYVVFGPRNVGKTFYMLKK